MVKQIFPTKKILGKSFLPRQLRMEAHLHTSWVALGKIQTGITMCSIIINIIRLRSLNLKSQRWTPQSGQYSNTSDAREAGWSPMESSLFFEHHLLYKKGMRDYGNYRPVSLTSVSGKIMKVILSTVERFLKYNHQTQPTWAHERKVLSHKFYILL